MRKDWPFGRSGYPLEFFTLFDLHYHRNWDLIENLIFIYNNYKIYIYWKNPKVIGSSSTRGTGKKNLLQARLSQLLPQARAHHLLVFEFSKIHHRNPRVADRTIILVFELPIYWYLSRRSGRSRNDFCKFRSGIQILKKRLCRNFGVSK